MKKLFFIFLIAILSLFFCFSSRPIIAKTFYVANSADLQAALGLADNNGADDIINMAQGMYATTVPFDYTAGANEGSLTIIGAGAGLTILNGTGGSDGVLFIDNTNGTDVTLQGVTIRNGNNISLPPVPGGGASITTNNGDINVISCAFENNVAQYTGGIAAIVQTSGDINFTGNSFTNNRATADVAIPFSPFSPFLGGGGGASALTMEGNITLMNNTFTNNQANGNILANVSDSFGGGGGFHAMGEYISLYDNTFTSNQANGDLLGDDNFFGGGGGARLFGSVIDVDNNTFTNNEANGRVQGLNLLNLTPGGGGGINVMGFYSATFRNNTFTGNHADGEIDTIGGGGGALATSLNVNFYNNIFRDNHADGGVNGLGGGGGAGATGIGSIEGGAIVGDITFEKNIFENKDYYNQIRKEFLRIGKEKSVRIIDAFK